VRFVKGFGKIFYKNFAQKIVAKIVQAAELNKTRLATAASEPRKWECANHRLYALLENLPIDFNT
jgi:hypothetical protein